MPYTTHGLTSLHEILGDLVVYRNLVPADDRLPSLAGIRGHLGLDEGRLPRKAEPKYGRVVAEMLRRARGLDLPRTAIRRLIYVGDTQMNDGTAFRNLCAAGEWPGWALIGRDEAHRPPRVEVGGTLDALVHEIGAGSMQRFTDFVAWVANRRSELAQAGLASIHADVWRRVQAGDPTPFKLYALVSRHPAVANSRRFEDTVGRHIAAVAATLPPDVIVAAQARGRARDLKVTVTEWLIKLREWQE